MTNRATNIGGGWVARVLLVLLAACAPTAGPGFRDASVPISSVALFDPAAFSGHWHVVGSYAGAPCGPAMLEVTPLGGAAFDLSEQACAGAPAVRAVARMVGPGRFLPDGGPRAGLAHWVLWVDQSYRTAVIGTPGGAFALILNRDAAIPADRLQAAREILDWNGYDLSRLVIAGKAGRQ